MSVPLLGLVPHRPAPQQPGRSPAVDGGDQGTPSRIGFAERRVFRDLPVVDWPDVDPACRSEACRIEAFDQLHAEYQQTNDRASELRRFAALLRTGPKLLQEDLDGVDLNEEAVSI